MCLLFFLFFLGGGGRGGGRGVVVLFFSEMYRSILLVRIGVSLRIKTEIGSCSARVDLCVPCVRVFAYYVCRRLRCGNVTLGSVCCPRLQNRCGASGPSVGLLEGGVLETRNMLKPHSFHLPIYVYHKGWSARRTCSNAETHENTSTRYSVPPEWKRKAKLTSLVFRSRFRNVTLKLPLHIFEGISVLEQNALQYCFSISITQSLNLLIKHLTNDISIK